ncbi:MAG: DUF460 domain-containing protein [Candidatus Aenigmatarchaeota archaeon]
MRSVIVGFDSGLTSALAILTINGNLIFLKSFRSVDKGILINEILKRGRPILLATDKKETPKGVKELASSLGCKILRPKRDLTREEKEELIKENGFEVEDDHQLDALASALFAFKKVRRKILIIENYLRKRNSLELLDEVVYHLFRSRGINVDSILKKLSEEKEAEEVKIERKEEKAFLSFLEEKLNIQKELQKISNELAFYKKIKMKFDELIEYKEKYEKLKKYFDILKEMEEIRAKKLLPVLIIEKIENLKEIDEHLGLKDRIVFSNDESGFKLLNEYEIKCLLTEVKPQVKTKFPIIKIEKDRLVKFNHCYGIEEKVFDEKMKEILKEELKKWVEEERSRL